MLGITQARQTQMISAILAAMQTIIRFTLLCSLSLGLLWTQLAQANDGLLAPPKHTTTSNEHPESHSEDLESNSNLTEALAPPKQKDGVDVRTYLRNNDQAKITEYSMHGRVFRVKVQPSGGLPAYYLEDDDGDGTLNKRLPGGYKHISPPMWIIKRF